MKLNTKYVIKSFGMKRNLKYVKWDNVECKHLMDKNQFKWRETCIMQNLAQTLHSFSVISH